MASFVKMEIKGGIEVEEKEPVIKDVLELPQNNLVSGEAGGREQRRNKIGHGLIIEVGSHTEVPNPITS